ncbi:uncharacterized protein BJ171DRAFT_484378 [Polychytrium aggregatum]|uniref:uncharacterized protein n=1 Tax=Polychytrium aggregatum TaxID=110093 RepID=UPI0022FE837A|nr:uncharacterized protein BJ171DRAFT_484378 [Polychytrium aggregatum]KAI9209551.1 hypothetical protein BJ171DRAFT_484378 [Polychytrium aggregatum]
MDAQDGFGAPSRSGAETMEIDRLLERAAHIVGPSDEKGETLGAQLRKKLLKANPELNIGAASDDSAMVLFLLAECTRCLDEMNSLVINPDAKVRDLGAKDLKLVNTLIEIIIFWGLAPFLEPNVGLPLSNRIKYTVSFSSDQVGHGKCGSPQPQLLQQSCLFLAGIMKHQKQSVLARWMVSRYVPDVFAGLLQLGYSSISPSSSPTSFDDQEQCRIAFEELFTTLDVRIVFESLMILQGTGRRPPPPWLKKIAGRYLSQLLMRPRGLSTVLQGTLPSDIDNELIDVMQLEKISNLILRTPWQVSSVQEYYRILGPQVLELMGNRDAHRVLSKAAAFIAVRMINKHPELSRSIVVDPATEPWMLYYRDSLGTLHPKGFDLNGDIILSTEADINSSLCLTEQLLAGNEPCPYLLQFLASATVPMYAAYAHCRSSKSSTKIILESVLRSVLNLVEPSVSVDVLRSIILDPSLTKARVAPGPAGGIQIVMNPTCVGERPLFDLDEFLEFLQLLDNERVLGDFFIYLIEKQSQVGDALEEDGLDPIESVRITDLVMKMMQKFGESIVKKPDHIIMFSKNMIFGADIDGVIMGLGLLSTVLNTDITLDHKHQNALRDVLVVLQIHSARENEELRELVKAVRLSIAAKLAACESASATASGESQRIYGEALKELQSDMVPIQARGMALLMNLIRSKDAVAETHLDDILDIFLDKIEDPDSFAYLNSIKGLSCMTDVYPQQSMGRILSRYSDAAGFGMDYRLRIGEAVLQTINRSGKVFSKYASEILVPVLSVLHDDKVEMRMSALSLVAKIAEISPFSVVPYIYQVLDYIVNTLRLEKQVETRRGAIVAILSIIRGIGPDAIRTVSPKTLKSIHIQLQYVEATDSDELTRLHSRVALAEFDAMVQAILFN